jgi:hypothetical protein
MPHFTVAGSATYCNVYLKGVDSMPHYGVVSLNKSHNLYLSNSKGYDVEEKNAEKVKRLVEDLTNTSHLFSFAYKDMYEAFNPRLAAENIIIDSGGYSIDTLGLDLNINDYMTFLKSARYRYAFNFDKIRNPEETYQNQKIIEDHGLEVIPVFHLGSPYKWLKKYIDEGYDYISLGGMVGKHNKIREQFLKKCFILGKKEGIKFHGLGVSHKYCAKYPLFSIDNSNHILVRRTGSIKINGNALKIPRVKGEKPEARTWNDAKPVLIQLMNNINDYKDAVKNNWRQYHNYFKGNLTYEEVIN